MPGSPTSKKNVPFQQIIDALLDDAHPFPPKYLYRFSDIIPEFLNALKQIWTQINPERRANLFSDLEEFSDTDTLYCFEDIANFALEDSDPRVRAIAIRLLGETGGKRLIPIYIRMAQNDSDEVVRATAATALGEYVYKGELEEVPGEALKKTEECLIGIFRGKDAPLVRRRALESLGFSSRKEVREMIGSAIKITEATWRASALFAIGRSADERWEKTVLKMIDDPDTEVQIEAVRAAGELEIKKARQPILSMLEDDEDVDEGIRTVAIWSLSQIGGEGVRDLLEKLLEEATEAEEVDDDEDIEYLENALDNLSFTEGAGFFDMLDYGLDEDDEDLEANENEQPS